MRLLLDTAIPVVTCGGVAGRHIVPGSEVLLQASQANGCRGGGSTTSFRTAQDAVAVLAQEAVSLGYDAVVGLTVTAVTDARAGTQFMAFGTGVKLARTRGGDC